MKKAKEWFLTMPKPLGQMAIAYTEREDKRDGTNFIERYWPSLPPALGASFIWADTDEGFDFWNAVQLNALHISKPKPKKKR